MLKNIVEYVKQEKGVYVVICENTEEVIVLATVIALLPKFTPKSIELNTYESIDRKGVVNELKLSKRNNKEFKRILHEAGYELIPYHKGNLIFKLRQIQNEEA